MSHVKQSFASICIPFSSASEWSAIRVKEIRELVGRLGNPCGGETKATLDAIGTIHFMSVIIIYAQSADKPPHLFIEITVDGSVENTIRVLGEKMGDALFPILSRACGLEHRGEVTGFLLRHNLEHSQNPFARFGKTQGLPFFGTPDLTVQEIKENQMVANEARVRVEAKRKASPQIRPQELLSSVREELKSNPVILAIMEQDKPPLPFAETADAPWLNRDSKKGGSVGKLVGAAAGWLFFALVVPVIIGILVLSTLFWKSFVLAWQTGSYIKLWALSLAWGVSALVPAVLLIAAVLGVLYMHVRKSEKANTPQDIDPDPAIMAEMMLTENAKGYAQNHMISVTELAPGFIRFITICLAFKVIAVSKKLQLSRAGTLNNIGTIHSARWLIMPKTRQLVFVSNFDGSWESYLEDFITKAASGTTGVWGNTVGFPRTENLFFKGVEDGDRFKRFARRSMRPTCFWYSAYPGLTCDLIRKQAIITSGLNLVNPIDDMEASHASAWFELFNSIPRPAYTLEYGEIQGLMFGGVGHLPHARCHVLNFGAGDDGVGLDRFSNAKEWIAARWKEFSFGNIPPADSALYVAFSAQGLRKLGLEEELDINREDRDLRSSDPTRFPAAFALGMAHPSRQRLLQDPAALQWDDVQADAVLYVYAEAANHPRFKQEAKLCADHGITVLQSIDLGVQAFDSESFRKIWGGRGKARLSQDDEMTIEPFGFVDGISQPKVRGFPGSSGAQDPVHRVEPGEFILGYEDNRTFYPPTPQLPAERHKGLAGLILPSPPNNLPQLWPAFGKSAATKDKFRDFGRNGSYLVVRQLAQDVKGFHKAVEEQANALAAADFPISNRSPKVMQEWVAAKMLGRWRNGSSLVENPTRPRFDRTADAEADNAFLFHDKDPQGLRCPFGAHVRRTFPRDSLNPDDALELSVSNRHRLLRRGRPFLDKKKQLAGTFFMCFNADLERQFEFVQQTWMTSPVFHGLSNEIDPIASHGEVSAQYGDDEGAGRCYSIPGINGDARLEKLQSFVTLEGGGYFFMPGRQALAFLGGRAWVDRHGEQYHITTASLAE
jgi:Dyp-type peroxidase family